MGGPGRPHHAGAVTDNIPSPHSASISTTPSSFSWSCTKADGKSRACPVHPELRTSHSHVEMLALDYLWSLHHPMKQLLVLFSLLSAASICHATSNITFSG